MIIILWIFCIIVWLLLGHIAATKLKARVESKLNEPAGPEFVPWRLGFTAAGLLGLLVYIFIVVLDADRNLYKD